ncbi:tetratricopeptide repeat protein [Spirosoma sp. BT702]|uniref:Tetratricopeptide repeat protein n=1 Tax=Spirosoma profusum TaxID=2771354 RepID=A0A926XYV2_9BACT|nr:tetratricopeptide repeat protein [Spirosoma profusum]MBD2703419.1 tetratricopeptide repeat protein [Spirosoma profusum]
MTVKFNELKNEHYLPLLTAMGYENVNWATDLLEIIAIKSVEEREIALDKYAAKHQPNSYYYALKGSTNTKSGRPDQAKQNYLQAIRLNSKNVEALNNLGLLFDHHYHEFQLAREYYESALEVDPKLTVARINLALLLTTHFNDIEGAKKQYETIIKLDPKEVKAYNNLANLYRREGSDSTNQDIAIKYFQKAIEIDPTYLDAYINYGNLLYVQGKQGDGDAIYDQGKQYDKAGNYSAFIERVKKMNSAFKDMNKIELTAEEVKWAKALGSFEISLDEDYELRIAKLNTAALLARSLLNRKAIPETRLNYFTKPEYNLSNTRRSHEAIFESNGTKGEEIFSHPHFLPYLRYFIYGAALPSSLKADLAALKMDHSYDDDFVEYAVPIIKKYCKDINGGVRNSFAEEVFKVCLDLNLQMAYATQLRNKTMSWR